MTEIRNKGIQNIEKKIRILRRIFIIGIILIIIGFCGTIGTMVRIIQIVKETDEIENLQERYQRQIENERELDALWVYDCFFFSLTCVGGFCVIIGNHYKKFSELREAYRNQLEVDTLEEGTEQPLTFYVNKK